MCRLWSTLSMLLPFQQSGKFTWNWSFDAGGHDGGVVEAAGGVATGWDERRIGP